MAVRLMVLFLFLQFGLCAQYTVHRNPFVYEIRDTTGRSVYQCFADTVLLMKESPYACVVKNSKTGVVDLQAGKMLFPESYDVFVYNDVLPIFNEYVPVRAYTLPNKLGSVEEYLSGGKKVLAWYRSWPQNHEEILIKPGFFNQSDVVFLRQSIRSWVTEPYYRMRQDGTRIDSIVGQDMNGNPIIAYPPDETKGQSVLTNFKAFTFKTADPVWFEKSSLYIERDTMIEMYSHNLIYRWTYDKKEIFSGPEHLYEYLKFAMRPEYHLGTVRKSRDYIWDTYVYWRDENEDDSTMAYGFMRKDKNGVKVGEGSLVRHYDFPYVRELVPAKYDFAFGGFGVYRDSSFFTFHSSKIRTDSVVYVVSIDTATIKTDRVPVFIGAVLKHISAGKRYTPVPVMGQAYQASVFRNHFVAINWFEIKPLSQVNSIFNGKDFVYPHDCFDAKGKFKQDCRFRNIVNKSGVFDLEERRWVIEPEFSMIDTCKYGFLVYRFSNADNYKLKLESGLFDGYKWNIPMGEQMLVEEKGILYRIRNGKKMPITSK